MIAPSNFLAPAGTDDALVRKPIVLECGGGKPPLHIAAASGRTYRITARDEAACARIAREALRLPAAEIVPCTGGLLSHLSVLENIVLPALYHRRVSVRSVAEQVYEAFEACDCSRAQADALCERAVIELDTLTLRLLALVRSLLMRPSLLLMERIFEGLTAEGTGRVLRFDGYYRRAVPAGTLIYVDLAGMARPAVEADEHADAE